MGQEASLPANDDDALEEQLAPPSVALPPGIKPSKQPKMIGNLIRSFEQREASRASAMVGNLYTDTSARTDDDYALQKMPEDQQQHQQEKKSIFPVRPSARGVISSMRNLSIGINRKQQKAEQIQDWEKQWYDDDDEDDDEEEEEPAKPPVSTLGLIRPGLDTGHTSVAHYSVPEPVTPSPPKGVPQPALPYPTSKPAATPDIFQPVSDTTPTLEEPLGRKPDVQMFLPMLRVLGKGSFGKVVLVQKRDGKDTGQLFAMKILKKTHLVKRRQIERTRTERKVLSVVNHPFIMKLHYAFQTPEKLYLVLDYCPGGELFFHLSRFRRFPERVARFYAAELLLAIGHLHKRGIIYRDLKPENVLLDADGHVKLGDFGLAKAGIQHPYEGATSMCGTPEYMAPEVLAQLGHGFCVDYWGLGMIVYEMMTGLPPWYTTDRQQLFRRLKSAPLDIPTYFSGHAAEFVASLLERNPRRRLGVTGIRVAMEHDFFRNISWRALYSRRVDAPVRPCEGWRPDNPDLATQNFDSQFTRMPVNSDDTKEEVLDEQLDENTFLGFSFDIVTTEKPVDTKHRTHHLGSDAQPPSSS